MRGKVTRWSWRLRLAAQDVVEYGLIIATIALVVLIGTAAFGTQIQAWFLTLAGRITTNT